MKTHFQSQCQLVTSGLFQIILISIVKHIKKSSLFLRVSHSSFHIIICVLLCSSSNDHDMQCHLFRQKWREYGKDTMGYISQSGQKREWKLPVTPVNASNMSFSFVPFNKLRKQFNRKLSKYLYFDKGRPRCLENLLLLPRHTPLVSASVTWFYLVLKIAL